MKNSLKFIVFSGVIAAAYAILTIALAPISYGPVQFRVSELLKPLALFNPIFAVAFGVGNTFANLTSPFGWYDFVLMPIVDVIAALTCWYLRRTPLVGLTAQSVIISAGVALFPLGMGAGLPFTPTFLAVLVSELVLIVVGYYVIWRPYGQVLIDKLVNVQ